MQRLPARGRFVRHLFGVLRRVQCVVRGRRAARCSGGGRCCNRRHASAHDSKQCAFVHPSRGNWRHRYIECGNASVDAAGANLCLSGFTPLCVWLACVDDGVGVGMQVWVWGRRAGVDMGAARRCECRCEYGGTAQVWVWVWGRRAGADMGAARRCQQQIFFFFFFFENAH